MKDRNPLFFYNLHLEALILKIKLTLQILVILVK